MYTPKERLKDVINKKEVDRAPCICPGGMMNMVTSELQDLMDIYLPQAHSDAKMMAKLVKGVYDSGCFENVGVPFCMCIEAEEMGAKIDMGSQIYEPHVIEYPISSVSDYTKLTSIDINKNRTKVVLDAIKILKSELEDVPVIGNLTGPISVASSLMEPTKFYKELKKNNADAHAFMDFVTEQLIVFGKAMIEAGADVITISEPSGTGEILGPKYFDEFVVKYLNKLLNEIKTEGVFSIVHICGQMKAVYHEIGKVNSDVLSFDSIVPIEEARKHLGNRVLMGNVSTYALEFQVPSSIKVLTKNCVKKGSDIISPACGLSMKSPLINVKEMLNTLKEND